MTVDDRRPAIGEPVLRWSARAHSIAEIESELARIWASQDLTATIDGEPGRHVAGADERDEPRRHRPPAGVRRALRGDHPGADRPPSVADDRHQVGRPRRAVVARRAGRGALRHAARRTRRRPAPRRSTSRAAARPAGTSRRSPRRCSSTTCRSRSGGRASRRSTSRPARDLLGRRGPPRRRRLDVERRRPRPPARDGRARRDARELAISDFALRPPVALAGGDRLDLRRSRTSCRTCARSAGSRSPTATHDETGAHGSTNLVKPVYHVGWLASRLGLSVVQAAGAGRPAQAAGSAAAARPGRP